MRLDIFLPGSTLLAAGQAGLCFREGLIVESGCQTTSECSFWKQSASRGRSSHGRHVAAACTASWSGSDIRIRGMPARSPTLPPDVAECQLSERLFHSPEGRRLWKTPKINLSLRSNYKGAVGTMFRLLTDRQFVVVSGLPGSGKSLLASRLSAVLGLPPIDKDDVL